MAYRLPDDVKRRAVEKCRKHYPHWSVQDPGTVYQQNERTLVTAIDDQGNPQWLDITEDSDLSRAREPHKLLNTTHALAVRKDQKRVHHPTDPIWHGVPTDFKCPDCDTVYLLSRDFPKDKLLEALKENHTRGLPHQDYFEDPYDIHGCMTLDDCICDRFERPDH
jgi:hypothetical protein